MARRRRGWGARPRIPVWVVACEDARTTPRYLQALQRLFHGAITIRIAPNRGHDTGPTQVVRAAVDCRNGRGGGMDTPAPTWAIIDAEPQEGPTLQERIDQALDQARREDVTLLIANPCFEHWLHQHLEDHDGGYGSAREAKAAYHRALERIAGLRPDRGGAYDWEHTVTHETIRLAAERSRARHNNHGGPDRPPHRCDPCCTNLHALVASLAELGPAGGGGGGDG